MFDFDVFNDWRDEMYELAKEDPWYLQCLKECAQLEPAFFAVWEKLTPQEQEVLDRYIVACEEACFALIYPAHELGKRKGK